MLKMERGSWDDPCARATRGLRRPSLDARSGDHPSHPLVGDRSLRPCLWRGVSWHAWAGRVKPVDILSILKNIFLLSNTCWLACRPL